MFRRETDMDLRRSGQLDERRRRVLMDEIASPSADAEQADDAGGGRRAPLRAYGPAVLAEHQPRITDLVPVRTWLVTLLILGAILFGAGIELLFVKLQSANLLESPRLAAVDLRGRGNLAGWFCSILLAAGAAASLVIYSIRCHRVDDYRGRYRIWLWTAGALLWASLDAATDVHHAIGAGLATLAGHPQWVDYCWLTLYCLVFGALAIRLAMETWHSLGTQAALALAAVLYVASGMAVMHLIPLETPLLKIVVPTALEMLAHLSVVIAIGLFARYVHLDAQGKLPVRLRHKEVKRKRRSRGKLAVVSDQSDAAEKDEEQTTPAKAESAARSTAAPSPSRPAGGPLSQAARSSGAVKPAPQPVAEDDGSALTAH